MSKKKKYRRLVIIFRNGSTKKFKKKEWTEYQCYHETLVVRNETMDIYGCNLKDVSEWFLY